MAADYAFYLYSLNQLRRAVQFAADAVGGGEVLDDAITEFDRQQPGVKVLRDAMVEHWDDYQYAHGRVAPGALGIHSPIGFGSSLQEGGEPRITSIAGGALGERIEVLAATADAERLYNAVRSFLEPQLGGSPF